MKTTSAYFALFAVGVSVTALACGGGASESPPGGTTGVVTGSVSGAATGSTTGAASGATTGAASGATTGAASGATTGAASGATTGAASGATTGASSGAVTGAVEGALAMDGEGWVAKDTNTFSIQGAWYHYSDAEKGGLTVCSALETGKAPYVAGKGMCLSCTTPGGGADSYKTWGAGVGLNLNQEPDSDLSPPMTAAPKCFTVYIQGTGTSDGLKGRLLPTNPLGASEEPPSINLKEGANEVCVDSVKPPSWCATSTTSTCLPATSLSAGIASLQIQAGAGSKGGTIDFCVAAVVPHS